jgi:hypothetical protein
LGGRLISGLKVICVPLTDSCDFDSFMDIQSFSRRR